MAAAGLGRCLVNGVRISNSLLLSASRVRPQSRRPGPWLPLRCCVASSARGYSSSVGAERRFTKEHEWVTLDGATATIGITDYAQAQLGDVTYVELPEVGRELKLDEEMGVVESVKAASDLYAPLSGKVTEVNIDLEDRPELVNEDPFGEGWMVKLEVSNKEEFQNLLTQDAYNLYIQ